MRVNWEDLTEVLFARSSVSTSRENGPISYWILVHSVMLDPDQSLHYVARRSCLSWEESLNSLVDSSSGKSSQVEEVDL